MHSDATTVEAYRVQLPAHRRTAFAASRKVILANLPDGYVEAMNGGMIAYEVPLATCPDMYNGNPLMYAALASQKNHMAVYLLGIHTDPNRRAAFEKAYRATGERFVVGKLCVRFRRLDHLPLELIGEAVAALPVDTFVSMEKDIRGNCRAKSA